MVVDSVQDHSEVPWLHINCTINAECNCVARSTRLFLIVGKSIQFGESLLQKGSEISLDRGLFWTGVYWPWNPRCMVRSKLPTSRPSSNAFVAATANISPLKSAFSISRLSYVSSLISPVKTMGKLTEDRLTEAFGRVCFWQQDNGFYERLHMNRNCSLATFMKLAMTDIWPKHHLKKWIGSNLKIA